uniref:Uncharacterized protein n=1 Tax=Biomphalaria glabrata TaxID=6526 RepID=A0A2C9KF70_BIOGL
MSRDTDARRSMLRDSDVRRSMLRDSDARRSMLRDSDARRSMLRDSDARRSMSRDSDARRSMSRDSDARRNMLRDTDSRRSTSRESNVIKAKIRKENNVCKVRSKDIHLIQTLDSELKALDFNSEIDFTSEVSDQEVNKTLSSLWLTKHSLSPKQITLPVSDAAHLYSSVLPYFKPSGKDCTKFLSPDFSTFPLVNACQSDNEPLGCSKYATDVKHQIVKVMPTKMQFSQSENHLNLPDFTMNKNDRVDNRMFSDAVSRQNQESNKSEETLATFSQLTWLDDVWTSLRVGVVGLIGLSGLLMNKPPFSAKSATF